MNKYWFKLRWYEIVCWIRHLFRRERKFYIGMGGDDTQDGLTWKTRRLAPNSLEPQLKPGDTVFVGPGLGEPVTLTTSGGPPR